MTIEVFFVLSKRFWIIPWPFTYNRLELDCIRKIINFWYTFGWKWRVFMAIWDCPTHVRMTLMTSSVERTDLDFKISVALLWSINGIQKMPFSILARGNENYRKLITILQKIASLNVGAITRNTHTLSVIEFGPSILPTASTIPRTSIIITTKTCTSCFIHALRSYFFHLHKQTTTKKNKKQTTTINSDQLNTHYVKFMCCASIDTMVYQTYKIRI